MKEITLHDDDPDTLEAMIRHIYNYWLRPPSLTMTIPERTHFYCNVAVVSDKYGLPNLTEEARKSLNTFVVSIEDPSDVVICLKIITEEYSDYASLDDSAVNLASPRLADLATVAKFPAWLATQPQFLQGIIQDAAKLRSQGVPPLSKYKTIPKYKCARPSCERLLLNRGDDPARCHGLAAISDGVVYCEDYS